VCWQEAFGPSTFFVTEMLLGGAAELTNGALRIPGGMLVRGNLRASREEAFDAAEAAIKRMFGARDVLPAGALQAVDLCRGTELFRWYSACVTLQHTTSTVTEADGLCYCQCTPFCSAARELTCSPRPCTTLHEQVASTSC
jgi:hypothetical protein